MQMDVKELGCFEKDRELFSRMYNGIPYWQIIRMTVFESIFTDHMERKKITSKKACIFELCRQLILCSVYSIYSSLQISTTSKAVMLVFKSTREKDRFFENWNIPDSINALYIRGNNDCDDFDFSQKYNILGPYLKANIIYLIKRQLNRLKRDETEKKYLDTILDELYNRYGKRVSADYIEKEILRYIEYRKYYTPFFEKLFKRTECKAIMVVWYYQMPMMIAYQVAKKMGVRVIELQHGIINNHEQYWFEDQRGVNNHTPDYFLAFGRLHIEWTKMLPSTHCVSVGYPFQEKEVLKFNDMPTEEKTIIIYPEDQKDFEIVINEFVNIAFKEGYRILMKLHPLQAEKYEVYYPLLSLNKNIEVVQDQSKGIYYWLKLGKFHVMANTTVGFEALAFEHTNICIAENINHEQVQPLLDWNFARGFHDANELINIIRNPINREKVLDNDIWEQNAEKNMEAFLVNLHEQGYPDAMNYKEID